jgi:hypothetical protein
MEQEPLLYLAIAAFMLASISTLSAFGLKAWHEWIAYKKAELDANRDISRESGTPSAASRIEVADLKERVKKLEAIAAGIDL